MREPGANDELLSLIIVSTATQRSIDLKNYRDICIYMDDLHKCMWKSFTILEQHTLYDETEGKKKLISFCVKPRVNSSMKSNFQVRQRDMRAHFLDHHLSFTKMEFLTLMCAGCVRDHWKTGMTTCRRNVPRPLYKYY